MPNLIYKISSAEQEQNVRKWNVQNVNEGLDAIRHRIAIVDTSLFCRDPVDAI